MEALASRFDSAKLPYRVPVLNHPLIEREHKLMFFLNQISTKVVSTGFERYGLGLTADDMHWHAG
jgi:hypothetical protein